MDLINPNSNISLNQERILAEMKVWTKDKSVIGVMLSERLATEQQMINLAVRVQATVEQNNKDSEFLKYSNPMTPKDTAYCAYYMLQNRTVRLVLSKIVAREHKVDKKQAMKDLWEMKGWLEEHYGLEKMRDAQEAGIKVLG